VGTWQNNKADYFTKHFALPPAHEASTSISPTTCTTRMRGVLISSTRPRDWITIPF
jgi:hypothetical protein